MLCRSSLLVCLRSCPLLLRLSLSRLVGALYAVSSTASLGRLRRLTLWRGGACSRVVSGPWGPALAGGPTARGTRGITPRPALRLMRRIAPCALAAFFSVRFSTMIGGVKMFSGLGGRYGFVGAAAVARVRCRGDSRFCARLPFRFSAALVCLIFCCVALPRPALADGGYLSNWAKLMFYFGGVGYVKEVVDGSTVYYAGTDNAVSSKPIYMDGWQANIDWGTYASVAATHSLSGYYLLAYAKTKSYTYPSTSAQYIELQLLPRASFSVKRVTKTYSRAGVEWELPYQYIFTNTSTSSQKTYYFRLKASSPDGLPWDVTWVGVVDGSSNVSAGKTATYTVSNKYGWAFYDGGGDVFDAWGENMGGGSSGGGSSGGGTYNDVDVQIGSGNTTVYNDNGDTTNITSNSTWNNTTNTYTYDETNQTWNIDNSTHYESNYDVDLSPVTRRQDALNAMVAQIGKDLNSAIDFSVLTRRLDNIYSVVSPLNDTLTSIKQDFASYQTAYRDGVDDIIAAIQGLEIPDYGPVPEVDLSGVIALLDEISGKIDALGNPRELPTVDVPEPDDDEGSDISVRIGERMNELARHFPFSIPWDVAFMLGLFRAEPVTPVFDLPVLGSADDVTFTVDLHMWDDVAAVARKCSVALFALGLALRTRSLIQSGGGLGHG